jgi:DNA polymerase III delta subunit
MKNFPDMEILSKQGAGEMILKLLSAPLPDEVDIIIDGPGLDMRKAYAKALKNAGIQIETFNSIQSGDKNYAENRRQTLENLLAPTGKKLEPQAMQYLLETVGGNSANLANEVEKLLLFTQDAPLITLADCEAITSRTPEAVGWEFTSAVTEGQASRALKLLDLLYTKDSDVIGLLASLSNEYQRYSKLLPAMRELGVTHATPRSFDNLPADVKSRFPDNPLLKCHPFRAYKMCEAAQKLGGHKIAEKLAAIRDASCAAVSGSGNVRILLEQLILKLCRN